MAISLGSRHPTALSLLVLLTQACGPSAATPAPQPAPTPQPAPVVIDSTRTAAAPDSAPAAARAQYTDAQFIQGMIPHHRQALVMAAMVPSRTGREAMHLLAERITVSQKDEIATMERWLREHGDSVPPDDTMHGMHGPMKLMPGMLTQAELAELAASKGARFDQLFLQYMIRHHEGALTMVADLYATPGSAQDAQVFSLASGIDSDQRAEIRRMQSLQRTLP